MLAFLVDNWLGVAGFISGIACVWLLIRENVLTFPIGLLYAGLSVVVMLEARLYADVLLNGYYVLMNAYGWYFWLYGRRAGLANDAADHVSVERLPQRQWLVLAAVLVAGSVSMGYYFDNFTDADLAYPDSLSTVLSFIAMWMAAKKYLENWILWFVVDVFYVVLYLVKAQQSPDLYFYAGLYFVYLVMAVAGYRAWLHSLSDRSANQALTT